MSKLTFTQFIILSDGEQLLEAAKKVTIPKIKPRPKKDLWFMNRGLWLTDLNLTHSGQFLLQTPEEDEESSNNWYATDPNSEFAYGMWHGKKGQGITFHKIRTLNDVKHPRIRLKKVLHGRQF